MVLVVFDNSTDGETYDGEICGSETSGRTPFCTEFIRVVIIWNNNFNEIYELL